MSVVPIKSGLLNLKANQSLKLYANPAMTFQNYRRRYDSARANAMKWWPILEACYHYCIPNRNLFWITNQTQGAQKNILVFDTTQVAATRKFVSKIHSALTPVQNTWGELEAGDDIPEDMVSEVNILLSQETKVLFGVIKRSNFDMATNECYHDLAVGTMVLVINEGMTDDVPIIFDSIPLDQVAIEESINHKLESIFRTWGTVKIMDIQSMWPKATLTSSMIQQVKENPSAVAKGLVEACIYTPGGNTPFSYVLWYDNDVLLEEHSASSKFVIARWSKINNESMGRGPIMDALPSIKSLQMAAYFEFTGANLNICKPYMGYNDGVFNPGTFVLKPNTIIPVAPNAQGNFPLQPLPDVMHPEIFQLTSADLRQQINTLMYGDPLGSVEAPPKTAYEQSLRTRNFVEEIGPSFTRLQYEYLEPVITRVIDILQKKGLMRKLVVNGREIRLKFKSPITASEGYKKVENFMQYNQMVQATVGPDKAVLYYNVNKVPYDMGISMGIDPTWLNDEEQMKALFEEQQAAMEEAKNMEMMRGMNGQG